MSYTISIWSLMGANLERYIAICKYEKSLTRTTKKAAIGCASIWFAAFIVCSPLLDAYEVKPKDGRLDCSNHFRWSRKSLLGFYGFHTLFVFVLPLLFMAFTFCCIIRALNASEKSSRNQLAENFQCSVSSERRNSEAEKLEKRRRTNRKITKLLLVITFMFVMFWSPYVILRLIKHSGVRLNYYVWHSALLIMTITSTTNFFIYVIMSKDMRKVFWSMIRRCCCNRAGTDTVSGSLSSTRSRVSQGPRILKFGEKEYRSNEK